LQVGVDSFAAAFDDFSFAVDPSVRLRNLVQQIEHADQVGLDAFGIGEHHRREFLDSAPAVILGAAAARTQRIRLTSAVTVLSAADPVRVFQSFATLDLLSQGRAEMVVGRGSFIEAFPLFGLQLEDYDALFAEKLDLLLEIRDHEHVHWSGKYRAALTGQGVYPRPVHELKRPRRIRVRATQRGRSTQCRSRRCLLARAAARASDHMVGHSYGGAVITAAAAGNPNVKALVYVAAFAPDSNEALGALLQRYPDLGLGKALAPDAAGFLYIDAAQYPAVFANGLPPTQARAFATAQKPIAGSALGEPLTVAPAWRTVPSWYVVATQDRAINPELERFMAKRMNAHVTELPAGHLVFISRAPDIARIIESASQ
jgi:alkanesulfonate monooxygenase SsuD/methylene tetrahydromethanopterin reductase-like flavin-dependent oxidoreductase (luciferase family)